MTRSIATCLMFESRAEEAMRLYVSLFSGSSIERIERYGYGELGTEGSIKQAEFLLRGHRLFCMDSPVKHVFTFTPSISIFVDCQNAAEQENAYAQLVEGGMVLMEMANYGFSARFAWINDRYGVSWQLNLP